MDIIVVRPDLRMLVGPPGQAYLLRRGENVLLVDTARVGDDAAIAPKHRPPAWTANSPMAMC